MTPKPTVAASAHELPPTDLEAPELLRWAVERFHPRLAFASSFGADDMVVLDMLMEIRYDVRVFTLDTGRLPDETYQLIERVRERYGIAVETIFPDRDGVETLVREKGPYSFRWNIENRVECCWIRKVEPLRRALADVDAWITGLRREQTATRASLQSVEDDPGRPGVLKLNPLADWSSARVWEYIEERGVPYNTLHNRGYPSIGCAPCTRAVPPGADPRSGRWWWELESDKECGLHPGAGLSESVRG